MTENNKLCNWLLYYSRQDSKVINSEIIIDIESSLLLKQRLCSSICYFECGHILFDDFPDYSMGFVGIFDYLVNDKGNVMEKMKIDEQRSYINKLSDCDNFSIRHHVSIIKCFMKSYVCQLAPWDRIKRAVDALGVSLNIDDARSLATFRHVQKNLVVWLKEAATRGLLRLVKTTKTGIEFQASVVIDGSSLGSLVLYTMSYYAQTKMIKYNVTIPDVDLSTNNNSSMSDISLEHSRIVKLAFAEICDNADILPLQIDCLLSRTMDTVPATLVIALIFHWTFGNSLKNLENLLRSSISSTNSGNCDKSPSHRPSHLPLHNNSKDTEEPRPFFMNSNRPSNDGLRHIFSRGKDDGHINGVSKSGTDGDTSPEIFLTPTEDEMPTSFINSVTPPIKLLSYKTVDNVPRPLNNNNNNIVSEPKCFNLKEEFQKKKKEKQNLNQMKSKVSIDTSNETTWLAQRSKNDTISIPLTPKKGVKVAEKSLQNDSSQSLTKGQLNDIQMQLSLRRKKIESDKKNIAQKTEKTFENHKQKAFFQAFEKGPDIVRRKSLELAKEPSNNDTCDGDRRLSMYITKKEKQLELSPDKKFNSFFESSQPANKTVSPLHVPAYTIQESDANEMEPPQSSQPIELRFSPLEICLERINDTTSTDHIRKAEERTSIMNDRSNEIMNDEPLKYNSRKNSYPSVSSLSSSGDMSLDKDHVTKDEYQKSIDLLSTSLTNLQEEIRFLSQQQLSWNSKISQPLKDADITIETDLGQQKSNDVEIRSNNNSVAETPTNKVISLTDITETPKNVIQMSVLPKNDQVIQRVYSIPTKELNSVNEISHKLIESNGKFQNVSSGPIETNHTTEISPNVSKSSPKLSPDNVSEEHNFDYGTEPQYILDDNRELLMVSINDPLTEDEAVEMSSSSESVKMASAQPVSFVIAEDQNNDEAVRKKAELLAKREQRRLLKLEMYRQRREQDRENRLSSANEELMERELKKRLEQEKRDSLLKKYLDRRNEESISATSRRSSSTAGTPVKSITKSQTLKPSVKTVKPESVENLSLASPQRNGWFSSMRLNNRMTSSSTSQLNTNVGLNDIAKFGVPLPPQEYMGPKLFGKRKVKTNRSVIANAIAHCCLAGSVNIPMKESVLKDLADAEGTHFMILFRDARCQYRSLYLFDLNTEDLNLITGTGPKRITHEMVEKFYKYNSGGKQFNPILSTKHLSPAVDAICIQSVYWNMRPNGQALSGAVSTMSISQTKNKRLL